MLVCRHHMVATYTANTAPIHACNPIVVHLSCNSVDCNDEHDDGTGVEEEGGAGLVVMMTTGAGSGVTSSVHLSSLRCARVVVLLLASPIDGELLHVIPPPSTAAATAGTTGVTDIKG